MNNGGFEDMGDVNDFVESYQRKSGCHVCIVHSKKKLLHCQYKCNEHIGCEFGFTVCLQKTDQMLHITNLKYDHLGNR